ncbi:hypothetical protein RHMOL_Rhmol10G0106100 [Rhododendron molle]|uniref:Uncharacterized protein n=2 Tax=Rhododendron molle TaxID=49168 RepID=A0ACC0M0W6_RHOML|nr:hypothetical protein RHMOL_Rhmol10G0106100 [Rhododendron molle]KAI8534641.1 hypothetical protein RHMOL_Rhmol10G0106100 [Rhododendron molle]
MATSALLPRWASPLLILSPHLSRRNLLPSTKYSTALLGSTSGRRLHISSPIPPAKGGPQVRARNSNRLPKSCSFCCGVEASVAVASDDNYGNKQVISVTPRLYDYLLTNVREPEILRELREETATMRGSQMQVSPDQAQLLAMLVQILGAEKCIEVGVYTGYSSLAIALVLPESGHLVACERDAVCLEVAKRYYDRAGVSHKVDVKHGLAADVLRSMIQLGETCSYDFAFVDAEKRMYQEYFELLLQLVRVGGLIVMDNVLWHGKVANPSVMDSKTLSIRNFNRSVMEDERVNISMVPIGDGMTICRKL